jgi:hypothetical protein
VHLARVTIFLLVFGGCSVIALGDQGAINNTGSGSASVSGGVTTISTTGATPAGTLNINATSTGGTITFVSTDGSHLLNGTIATSSSVESCSGGGRGGHVTCGYNFAANFSGTLTLNGQTEAIIGTA